MKILTFTILLIFLSCGGGGGSADSPISYSPQTSGSSTSSGSSSNSSDSTSSSANDNQPPVISGLPDSVSINENTTEVIQISASDPEGQSINYRLTGRDSADFSISTSGLITLNNIANYETKSYYELKVIVGDGLGESYQDLQVKILNINEPFVQIGSNLKGDESGDRFGYSIDIAQFSATSGYGEGSIIAIGAPRSNGLKGSVKVFQNRNGTWTQWGDDIVRDYSNHFGTDVSLSSDGRYLAISEYGEVAPYNEAQVFIYSHNIYSEDITQESWYETSLSGTQQDSGTVADLIGSSSGGFGRAIQFSGDGQRLAVTSAVKGIVTVFQRTGTIGERWSGIAEIEGGGCNAPYGDCLTRMDINFDGTILAAYTGSEDGADVGEVTIVELTSTGIYQKGTDLIGTDSFDNLGHALSLSGDGNTIAVSVRNKARIYEFSSALNDWVQKGSDISGFQNDVSNLSLSHDGLVVAIGGDSEGQTQVEGTTSIIKESVGKVVIYEFVDGEWVQLGEDINGKNEFALFGRRIKLNSAGNVLVTGQEADPHLNNDISGGVVRIYGSQ